jgi:hypothetical protein
MVFVTQTVLPASPVRLSSILVVVVAAGIAAEFVLGHLRGLASRHGY